ncbi:hypothetical protein [Nocardioides sp.]|uniref:hypothetical protein n=1 Tax=Nocardioides sp. TaxID=35761 RepID=UPI002EDA1E12
MRPPHLALLAVLVGLAVAPYPQQPAAASCAGPTVVDAGRLVLERGVPVAVAGVGFVDGCQDSMSCSAGPGCDSCEYADPEPTAYDDVRLRLRQDGRTWLLDTADAGTAADGRAGQVSWRVDLPAGVRPGRARLLADHAQPVTVRIR